jgi:hypothetical protein
MADEIINAIDTAFADGPSSKPDDVDKPAVRRAGRVIQDQLDSVRSLATTATQQKAPVRVVRGTNVSLTSALRNGDVIDGVTVATGDRVGLIGQTEPAENGIYLVITGSGLAPRASDADTAEEIRGMQFYVNEGDGNGGKSFACTATGDIVLGTTALRFVETSNQIAVNARVSDLAEINGTWEIKQSADGEIAFVDQYGFSPFRTGNNGTSFGDAVSRPDGQSRIIVVDRYGWGFELGAAGGGSSGGGGGGSGEFTAAEIEALNARSLALSSAVMNASNTFTTRLQFAYNHVLEYGQSLSIATEAYPAKSKTAMFGNMSFGESVLPTNLSLPTFTPHGSAALYPLTAKVQSGADLLTDAQVAALEPGNAATGEQMSIGFANFAKALHNLQRGVENDADRTLVVSSCGRGGQTIAQLSKGADPNYYGRLPDVAGKVKALASTANKTYGIGAFLWAQGENDYSAGTTKAAYKAAFLQLLADVKADVVDGVSGQSRMPIVLTYQTGGSFADDSQELAIANAQLELSNEIPEVVMYAPSYPVTDKGGHLSADGSRWMGMQAAKVFHRVVTLGLGWKPLQPTQVSIRGRQILIGHHVPKPPLAFRKPYVGFVATDYTNKGYRVTDNSGTIGISSVDIVGDAVVSIALARDPIGPVKVWYGDKGTHNGNGCLADSDDALAIAKYEYAEGSGDYPAANIEELVNKPYPLNNWCVSFVAPAEPV